MKEARSSRATCRRTANTTRRRNEQAKLFGRIAEVEDILAHAVIIDETVEREHGGHIGLGCTVRVQDLASGERLRRIRNRTGSQEANPMLGMYV